MVASKKLTDHPAHLFPIDQTGESLLRTAVLYGANAAGKSNLIKAMAYAQRFIRERSEYSAPFEPFRFSDSNDSKTSSFEFRILLGERVFVYGFDVAINKVENEWLILRVDDDEPLIFQRDAAGRANINATMKSHFPEDDPMFSVLDKLHALPLRPDQLFLNRAFGLPEDAVGDTLGSIIRWFRDELLVITAETRKSDILTRLNQDPDFKQFCARFLSNVGTGVGDLFVHERERDAYDYERRYLAEAVKHGQSLTTFFPFVRQSEDTEIAPAPDKPGKVIERKLFAFHPSTAGMYPLAFSEESDGTQVLLNLLPILSGSSESNLIIVIDEINRSLHPLLCWEFIRFFSESRPGSRKQLIVTTHDVHLLNQKLLRRDEYWFVEKDQMQQTQLVSLSDFNIRNDLKLEKGYLQGRFGAIPIIGGMHELERLLDCSAEEPDASQEASS